MARKEQDKKGNQPKEHHPYDKIFKENIGAVFEPFLDKELGLDIDRSEELKDKLQTTLERESDFLRKVYPREGAPFILHLEFQVENEAYMVYRMQEYHAIIQKKYRLPVRQYVIFLGQEEMTMRAKLREEEVYTGFGVVNLSKKGYQSYLDSEVPEEVMMALLADFGPEKAEEVIKKILGRLVQLKTDKGLLSKYLRQLFVLARLRDGLDVELNKQINDMALTIDIEQSILFKQGMEKGMEKGKVERTVEVILKGHANGLQVPVLANITNMPAAEVVKVLKEHGLE